MSQAESSQAENPSARLQLITKLNIYNLENEPKSSNVLTFGSKFGFRDHFMIELIHTTYLPNTFDNQIFPLKCGLGIGGFGHRLEFNHIVDNQGPLIPASMAIISSWIPPAERSLSVALIWGGIIFS